MLCHGYTGVKDLYLPDNARVLNDAGYVVLTFDYKGWGTSEGTRSRLAPLSRVADVQAAMTFLGLQANVDEDRLGIYGTSYGGATVVWTAAIDARVKCVVVVRRHRPRRGAGCAACAGPTNGSTCWRAPRRTAKRACSTGKSEFVERAEILLPDRQSAELAAAARKNNPNAVNTIPLEYIDETLQFHPEWVVDRIAPRPLLLITTDDDRLVPPEEFEALYAKAGEPKKLVDAEGLRPLRGLCRPAFTRSWARPSPGSGAICRAGDGDVGWSRRARSLPGLWAKLDGSLVLLAANRTDSLMIA